MEGRRTNWRLCSYSICGRIQSPVKIKKDTPRPHVALDRGAEAQDRTADTAIFSRVLYQLSYLGPSHAKVLT